MTIETIRRIRKLRDRGVLTPEQAEFLESPPASGGVDCVAWSSALEEAVARFDAMARTPARRQFVSLSNVSAVALPHANTAPEYAGSTRQDAICREFLSESELRKETVRARAALATLAVSEYRGPR